MLNDVRDALRNVPVSRKSKRLLTLWPVIEAKIKEGVSYGQIVQALNAGGLPISANTFKTYLYRHRKRQRKAPGAAATTRPQSVTPGTRGPINPTAAPPAGSRPQIFDWDPRGMDPALLK